MDQQSATICSIWDWTEANLLEVVGTGPYVIYGGGADPPPVGYTIGGIPVLHDPNIPFNCTRIAQQPKG